MSVYPEGAATDSRAPWNKGDPHALLQDLQERYETHELIWLLGIQDAVDALIAEHIIDNHEDIAARMKEKESYG